jgi:predicted DNA-binding transcriptional regulator YafY
MPRLAVDVLDDANMTTETSPQAGSAASAGDAERAGGLAASAIVRTQRALQILRLLQAGQIWSASELAGQFGCSTRTIFRDLQLLRECGIPIDSPRGERGFRLAHDFFWQPVRPTMDEMIALVVGARMASEAMPKEMAKHLDSALAKIVGSERPNIRRRLSELNMRIDAPHLTPQAALPEVGFLQTLLEQIVAGTHVQLHLLPAVSGQAGEDLEVIPLRLHFGDGQWQLIVTAWQGGSQRSIPLSRIERIQTAPVLIAAVPEPEPAPGSAMREDQQR